MANPQAYYDTATITAVESFVVQAPVARRSGIQTLELRIMSKLFYQLARARLYTYILPGGRVVV
jgi:hypothetical protein